MSGRFVRKSHFRHVFGKAAKKENTYFDIKLATNGDGMHIAANDKYIIYATTGGGGPACVIPYGKTGRVGVGATKINIHTAKTADFMFSPFTPNVLATAAEDCMVGISVLPENPEDFKGEPNSSTLLEGHQKKVDFVNWHPTAQGILASIDHDGVANIWDVEESKEALTIDFGCAATCYAWNTNGSMAAAALSNKTSVLYDPRTSKPAHTLKTGFKNAKNIFHDNVGSGMFGVGGSKMGCHEYHIYDMKKLSEPVTEFEVDDSAGMICTYYDPDTKMLYLGSKGGSQIKYFELDNNGAMHKLSLHSMSTGIKGFFFFPKLMCNWKECVIAKSFMLFRDLIQPVDFIVPRKSQLFAKDLYPAAYAGVPSLTGAQWLSGENKDPVLKSMDPKKKDEKVGGGVKIQTKADLIAENKKLKEKIKELEAKLAAK